MNNYLIYDWVSFTSKIHDHRSIREFLGLQDCDFDEMHGFYGYRHRLYFLGISIHYDGFNNKNGDMGVCVEMSGQGCRTFEKYGSGDYDKLFSEILDNYNDKPDIRQMNITRLDVAFDDFTGLLDLKQLISETQMENFVSSLKHYQYCGGSEGYSVTHGSQKSSSFIRIYDKRLEQKAQDRLDHWVRLELQLRRENALGFIELKEPFRDKFFMALNHYLRYIVPTNNKSNKCILDTAPFWLNFLESAEKKSIFHKPADSYDFLNLKSYVENQLSGSISAYIDVVGVDQFLVDVHNSRKGKAFNPKYKDFVDEPGSGILKYLEEHGLNYKKKK